MQRARARVKQPVQQFFHAPRPGDLVMLRRIVGNFHVGVSNNEVANRILEMMALADKHKKPINGLRTLDAWRNAAIDIHIENAELYRYVMTGFAAKRKARSRSPIV